MNPKALSLTVLLLATLTRVGWAQGESNVIGAEESDQLVARLQRIHEGEFSCLHLRQDNHFHLEFLEDNKLDIREGALSEAASAAFQALLANQDLAALRQEQIREHLLSKERHIQLAINIHRTPGVATGWQNLLFNTTESQQDFRAQISPILKWFDSLRKEPHISLSEEKGRNNCRLGKIKLKARAGTDNPTPLPVPFLLRTVSTKFGGGYFEGHCAIVYPKGLYHLETAKRLSGESSRSIVYDDALSEAELITLRQLLDDPALVASTHFKTSPNLPLVDSEFLSVFIPRADGTQRLAFATFSVLHGFRAEEKSDTGKDTSVFGPV